ncbi:A/G-specific adenine glycosylase [Candidatus Azambacteria bacterium]|nr:A/G-specific adenine glycosylase [Candidatus Azambacteria bacterium]
MSVSPRRMKKFRDIVWRHYHEHGRALPWRNTKDPYRIVASEIMLQQTQVERVLEKYPIFVRRFPSWKRLARATPAQALAAWQGLGYNRRALALKRIAETVVRKYKGKLPKDPALLEEFPGIGSATAGSICAFAFNIPVPFIETNIRRAYIHFFFPKKRTVGDDDILPLVKRTVDTHNPREWFWALMDYGSMLGRREKENPNRRSSQYHKQSKFRGSDRQLRGNILTLLIREGMLSHQAIAKKLNEPRARVRKIILSLAKEKFIHVHEGKVNIVR